MKKVIISLTILVLVSALQAGPTLTSLLDLYNTGVDDSGTILATDTFNSTGLDTHYSLTVVDAEGTYPNIINAQKAVENAIDGNGTAGSAYAINKHNNWVAPSGDARWIAPTGINTNDAADYFVYTLSFDVPVGIDTDSLVISGNWATDNTAELFLFSSSTGNIKAGYPTNGSQDFGQLDEFTVTGLDTGVNNLHFVVYNEGGPTGLLVQDINATVPAPGAFLLGGIGVGIVGWIKRRRCL